MKNTFWILWNPSGQTPPTVTFNTLEAAKQTAEKMQTRIGVGTMFVMRAEAAFRVELKSKWDKADGKL